MDPSLIPMIVAYFLWLTFAIHYALKSENADKSKRSVLVSAALAGAAMSGSFWGGALAIAWPAVAIVFLLVMFLTYYKLSLSSALRALLIIIVMAAIGAGFALSAIMNHANQ